MFQIDNVVRVNWGKRLKVIKLSRTVVPAWLIVLLIVSGIGLGALTSYVWQSVTIPFEVKEPLEILGYTSEVSLYPGATQELNATVRNNAPINYSVQLGFHLSDVSYQQNYVKFSDETYNVTPGEHTLTGWVSVAPCAPPINTQLTIEFRRICPSLPDEGVEFTDDFESYAVGTFPSAGGWELWYPGADMSYQVVVDFLSFSPTKSLQLLGEGVENGFHMAAVTAYPIVWNGEISMSYSAYVMVDEVCEFDSSAVIGFGKRTPEGVTRSNEVRFYSDGMIKTLVAGNEKVLLQSYEPDTWYKIEAILDTATNTFSIWIDGELKASNLNARFPPNEIDSFLLTSNWGNVKAYFDDATIFQND